MIDILALLAAGLPPIQIVEELPDLREEDVRAALFYTARRFDRRNVTL